MLSQARAAATRQRIIDVATELFEKSGFNGTNLNQIIRTAHVTPGAFYYHFSSKDEVAFAIIDQVAQRMTDLRTAFVGRPESGLENVIEMTFQLSSLLGQDRSYWVAAFLEHTIARHTQQGIAGVAERVEVFIVDVAHAIQDCELRDGVDPDSAARTMLTLVYGCLAMTDLVSGGTATRLEECWRILIPGLVPPDSIPHFEKVLARAVARI